MTVVLALAVEHDAIVLGREPSLLILVSEQDWWYAPSGSAGWKRPQREVEVTAGSGLTMIDSFLVRLDLRECSMIVSIE